MEIKIKVDGLDELLEAFEKAPEKTIIELEKAVKKTLFTVQSNAIKEAPANKQIGQGARLRQSFFIRMNNKLSGVLYNRQPYALYVHEGTRPHEIRPREKKVLANRRTGQFFGKLVHHPGTQANQFFSRAVERSKAAIQKNFDDVIKAVQATFPKS